MKSFLLFIFLSTTCYSYGQESYQKYFTDQSMRVDFIIGGNADTDILFLEQIKKEPFWGGSKTSCIDAFNYGEYKFEVIDSTSGQVIFSRGLCTLFEEWQTTTEAQSIDRSYYQSITFPYPKNQIILKVYSRTYDGEFEIRFEMPIQPDNYFINPEIKNIPYKKLIDNGDPANKVDLVFLAEGYTINEMEKFESDAQRMVSYLFSQEPYKLFSNKFNVWIVNSPSENSGTDIPGANIYMNTAMNSNFYTFDSERYLTTNDVKSVRDIAGIVPYDEICILVNSNKYGGGGVYNHYAITTVDHILSEKVFIHEFGHSFAGLGDEYYNSSTSYNDFYNLAIEPWQPNLTTMVNFDSKWKSMIDKNTPIPTPRKSEFNSILGVYEGGGYLDKGIYSPMMDCRMKSNEANGFCPVCSKAILDMIMFKSE